MDEERYDEVELEPIEKPRQKSHIWLILGLVGGAGLLLLVLLLGMLLPAVGTARELARTLKCKNNLKQLGIAMFQYIDERGSHRYYPYPKGRPGVPDDYNGKHFLAMIWWTDLVSEPEIFICPNSTDDNNKGYDLGVRDKEYTETDVGGVNQRGNAPANVPEPNWGPHVISYASKGWKVSFLPNSRGGAERFALTDQFPSDTIIASDDTVDPPNHTNGFCVLYADCHVEFLTDAKYVVTEENGAVGRVPPLDMICN